MLSSNEQFISFFHNSDEYRTEFTNKDERRPCFYWFSENFHDHVGHYDYFYCFLKNPKKDNIALRARQNDGHFNGLWENYLSYLEQMDDKKIKYAEPPILMSFSRIVPDIIASRAEDGTCTIIKPNEYKGEIFQLEIRKPLLDIPIIKKILPTVTKSLPFVRPESKDGKYIYHNWVDMEID